MGNIPGIMPVDAASVEVPEGRYIFCDPCTVMRPEDWKELLEDMAKVRTEIPLRFCDVDGECGYTGVIRGGAVAMFSTLYGDGVYEARVGIYDAYLADIGVDAGVIGLVDEQLAIRNRKDAIYIDGPAVMILDNFGRIRVEQDGKCVARVRTADQKAVSNEIAELSFLRFLAKHSTEEQFFDAVKCGYGIASPDIPDQDFVKSRIMYYRYGDARWDGPENDDGWEKPEPSWMDAHFKGIMTLESLMDNVMDAHYAKKKEMRP